MVDELGHSVSWAQGEATPRGAIGGHTSDAQIPVKTLDADFVTIAQLDVRGLPRVTVYVENTGVANAASVQLLWYTVDFPWHDVAEDYNVAAGITDIRDFNRAAHKVLVQAKAADGTTVRVAIVATHGA